VCCEGKERLTQVEPEIDRLLQRLAALWKMLESLQRLLEVCHCLPVSRVLGRLGASLPTVSHGLVPHLPPPGMLGQALDLLGQSLGIESLKPLDNASMEGAPPLLEQTAVGDLVSQGVLEGEFALWEQLRLVEKLSCLQVVEATVQRLLGQLGNGLQQGEGHLCADDRRGLEQTLLLGRQPVDARC